MTIRIPTTALTVLTILGGVCASAQTVTIDLVTVGNPGNAADTTGYGAVAYMYQIGKYEVTNAQYAAFLNAVAATDTHGLYNTNMGSSLGGINRTGSSGGYSYAAKSGFENKPVNYVSFLDAARFANWLSNGQGGSSTETGSYTITSGAISGNTVTRNAGAIWAVVSEDEWYKAAYYDPTKNSGTGGYWLYPTRSDALGNNTAFGSTNGANYYDGDWTVSGTSIPSGNGSTVVGAYVNAASFYGTFDQGGNVREWNETIGIGFARGLRGGNWGDVESILRSSSRQNSVWLDEFAGVGFRVVNLTAVPEPSAFAAVTGGLALVGAMMRRRRRIAAA